MTQTFPVKTSIMVAVLLFLVGCDQYFQPYQPTAIDIVPVKVSADFYKNDQSMADLKSQMDEYIERHRASLLNEPITVSWAGKEGKTLAAYVREQLLVMGVEPDNISYEEQRRSSPTVIMSYITHQIQSPVCPAYHLSSWHRPTEGCFVESNRWQSIVHPEKMIGE